MRLLLLACSLLMLPVPASALCRCACVRGVMTPICQPTDLVHPICQGLCEDSLRPDLVVRPLAGGQQQFNTVEPFDPAPIELRQKDPNFGLDTRGNPLGTAGVQSGNDAFSGTAAGAGAGAAAAGAAGALGR